MLSCLTTPVKPVKRGDKCVGFRQGRVYGQVLLDNRPPKTGYPVSSGQRRKISGGSSSRHSASSLLIMFGICAYLDGRGRFLTGILLEYGSEAVAAAIVAVLRITRSAALQCSADR